MRFSRRVVLAVSLFLSAPGCGSLPDEPDSQPDAYRQDDAVEVDIPAEGSLQNPAWSPDGASLLVTRFSGGYNAGPADLLVVDPGGNSARVLVSDGSDNVNLPGSAWNPATGMVAFSSSREPHDEVFVTDGNGAPGDETRVTDRTDKVAYEPSFSPDGLWIVFESHPVDVEDNGVIMKYMVDGSGEYESLTQEAGDCRQPNWSPAGDLILYQAYSAGRWDVWVTDVGGIQHERVTSGGGDKTDASFSPDGRWIVYSSDEGGLDHANLFIVSVEGGESTRISFSECYDGAPSWSPDGGTIVFESSPRDPEESGGTSIWTIDVPPPFLPSGW